MKTEDGSRYIFSARSVDVESSPPLAADEVRLCELPRREVEMYERDGVDALLRHWKASGKPARRIVTD